MYHARTKKVASYGRRAQRVVAVSDDRRFGADVFSISSDLEVQPARHGANDPSDDVFERPKKCASSKPSSPNVKAGQRSRGTSTAKKPVGKTFTKEPPIRKPLGSCPLNIPKSPAASPRAHKVRPGNSKAIRLGAEMGSTTPSVVDIDIIVLDDDGTQLDKQHRVTKNAQSSVPDSKSTGRPRRSTTVKNYAVYASGKEDDDDDEYKPIAGTSLKTASKNAKKPVEESKDGRPIQKKTLAPKDKVPDEPESNVLCKPKASRRALQTVVLTDSDSDSGLEESSRKATKKAFGKGASDIRTSRNRETKISTKPRPTSSACSTFVAVNGTRSPSSSFRGESTVESSQLDRRDEHSETLDSSATEERTQKTRHRVPAKTDSDDCRVQSRRGILKSVSRPENGHVQQRTARLCPSPRLTTISYDDLSLSMDEELEMALHIADLQVSGLRTENTSNLLVDELGAKRSTVFTTAPISPLPTSNSQRPRIPSFLRPLLSECGQLATFDFANFIESFPADPMVGYSGHSIQSYKPGSPLSPDSYQKVGEASYSEVFGIGNVVLKIIPLFDEEHDVSETWTADWDSPPVSEVQDVLKEVVVTRAMGEICRGFIKLLKAHVVQGSYPESLLTLWDKFHSTKGSESVRPDHFTPKQTYAVIILPNGGPDLENFSFSSLNLMGGSGWRQACSIFWQVARSLANAEDLVHFEHRDLHWGQILVRSTMRSILGAVPGFFGKVMLDDPWHGVQSTIIDLGLSRIDHGHGDSFWTTFDDEVFEGKGDYQYDIYRMMRHHNRGEWSSFRPLTNVMWLHYLTNKLIRHKHLRPPPVVICKNNRKCTQGNAQLAVIEADRRAYDCLLEMERVLGYSVAMTARSAGAKSFKASRYSGDEMRHVMGEMKDAGDVLRFGKERGWIM